MPDALIETELRSARLPTVIGIAIMATVLIFVVTVIRPLAAVSWPIDLWVATMAAVLLAIGTMLLTSLAPGAQKFATAYLRSARALQSAMSTLIMLSFWVLMPAAGPGLQPLMLMMYVWYIATVVAASTAAVPVPARDIILLTASAVGWVVWDQPSYWQAWAAFLTMAGATMLGFRRLIRHAVVTALEAKLASEAAEVSTRAALATAEAARDAKARFMAAASHDLQQPMQAASLFFDVALALPEGAERRRAVAGAHAAFDSSRALVTTMLEHLRLEADAVPARLVPVAVDDVLARAALEHGAGAGEAGMTIRQVPSRLWVTADAEMLRRALSNLVANAIRHSRGEHVLLAARKRGDSAEIWAIDDGNGIASVDAPRIFDDFAQGTACHLGGFGIGLAIVRRQMALMRGTAAHEPRWRSGAAFVLRLPLASSPPLLMAAE